MEGRSLPPWLLDERSRGRERRRANLKRFSLSLSLSQAELFQNYTTIEYTLRPPASTVPTYLMVVDTVLAEEELGELKKSLQQALSLLPENALVGLITFGTHVQVRGVE